MKYHTDSLNTLTPGEFEYIREKGAEYRRELSNAVLVTLSVPPGWCMNAEYRSEFGGMFPVQCRLSMTDCDDVHLCICSPGELSPFWLVVLLSGEGSLVRTLMQSDRFDPAAINHLINRVAGLSRFSITAAAMLSLLNGEGTV
ncbi:conjugation system SOS inhibitor PsiB [Scandinavium sp. NPDC088450]|uniref:conjugation system SOS inhibitor PsiB n=1 Tax=Scandinavium sp. NPDC088450 TaxID=3364514 RepID=UPI00384F4694